MWNISSPKARPIGLSFPSIEETFSHAHANFAPLKSKETLRPPQV
jgi:hypothetical protein